MGPAIVATPATAPQTPSATPRRSAGNVPMMIVIVCGIRAAAPSPCTARAAMSWAGSCDRPHSTEATVNSATPPMNMARGPRTSPSRPNMISSAARTRM